MVNREIEETRKTIKLEKDALKNATERRKTIIYNIMKFKERLPILHNKKEKLAGDSL